MKWRRLLLLGVMGLTVAIVVGAFQSSPGYMDADSYYVVSQQLATGHGFTEPYIWNYLDNPPGLPHPSNSYWMPLASLLAAAGAWIFGAHSWIAARIGFLVVTALIPPITYLLAWTFNHRNALAFESGLLAVIPVFYLPFLPITDTFGLYMLLGAGFFILISRILKEYVPRTIFLLCLALGTVSGLMHLARADGILWFFMALLAVLYFRKNFSYRFGILYSLLCVTLGYLLIMLPWFIRNMTVFGTPMAPGGIKMFWLTSYDQLFSYPASLLTFTSWFHSGILAILKARLWALSLNLATFLAVQGEIILLPFIGIGIWGFRKDPRIQLALIGIGLTFLAMTVAFPFAGARGGYFHSGAALQPVWWVMAPIGFEKVINWGGKKRGWNVEKATKLFGYSLIGSVLILSAIIFWTRIIGNGGYESWDQESTTYSQIDQFLVSQGVNNSDTIMVSNPPGFFLASGNPSIAVPYGDRNTILNLASRYNVTYLVLEEGSVPVGLLSVYDDPENQGELKYIGEINSARVFLFPHE
jgi:hypothetical protein